MDASAPSTPEGPDRTRLSGVIAAIDGHAAGRGVPEGQKFSIQLDDGTRLQAGMPRPMGLSVTARLAGVDVSYFDFGECPICLEGDAASREHVPPHAIGGSARTLTCARCNNEFGSRFEPHLQRWYEQSIGRVRMSAGSVPGRRTAGELLYRETPSGAFILLQTGKRDPELEKILQNEQFEITYPVPDMDMLRVAVLKNAYLAACLMLRQVPRTQRADVIRRELVAARDSARDVEFHSGPIANQLQVGRAAVDAVAGEIVLVVLSRNEASTDLAIGFNRVLAVDWPLDPIEIN